MAKSIRISDALYQDASLGAALLDRSLAQQVEYWARLGQATQAGITDEDAMQLRLKLLHIRDAQRIKRGEISASSLAFIPAKMAKGSSLEYASIDADEFLSDYDREEEN